MSTHFPPQKERLKAPDPRLLAALPTGRDTVPIGRARKHLAASLEPKGGTTCVVCGQHAELYRRRIHATMARQLIVAYREVGTRPFHAPSLELTGDFTKLAYWGLIAEQSGRRVDGGHHGRWRITKEGVAFLEGRARVPEWVLVYNGEKIGTDGDPVGLASIMGEGFDLRDIRPANLPPEPEPDPARSDVVDASTFASPRQTQEVEDAYQAAAASDAAVGAGGGYVDRTLNALTNTLDGLAVAAVEEDEPLEDLTVATAAIPEDDPPLSEPELQEGP
jgi:hypothetical protein